MALHFTTRYAIECVEKKRNVGRMEMLACLRHLHDLALAGQLSKALTERVRQATGRDVPDRDDTFGFMFDHVQADFVAVDWFGSLVHVKGRLAGQPIVLIDSHRFEVSMIFGWVSRTEKIKRSNGRTVGIRRFRKVYITEGRKNAKTTRGSAIALYMMVGDMESSPEVYCTAVDKKQARTLFNSSKEMAQRSKDISSRLKVGKFELNHKKRGGEMVAFSGEIKNKDSFSPSCTFVDEYHAHPTSELYDVMWTAQGQRAQPLLLVISTAGNDIESPCHREYEICKMILEGQTKNDHYFVMIREMDEGDDEHDPKNWAKANPLLMSDPISAQEFQDAHDDAFGTKDPTKIRTFRIKKLNIWVHGNESTYMGLYLTPALGEKQSAWDKCAVPHEEFLELTENRLCLVGWDLSKKIDLTASGNVFQLEDGRIAVSSHGFLPEGAVEMHEQTDKIPYREWARDGWLTITQGDVTDYREVQEYVQQCEKEFGWKVHELCYDPYNATHASIEMAELGFITVEVAQWMKVLSEPTKTFRELVASGKLVHDGSPLLRWAVGNAKEIVDTKENIMLSKKKSGDTRRIDPVACILTAMTRLQALKDGDMSGILDENWSM